MSLFQEELEAAKKPVRNVVPMASLDQLKQLITDGINLPPHSLIEARIARLQHILQLVEENQLKVRFIRTAQAKTSFLRLRFLEYRFAANRGNREETR